MAEQERGRVLYLVIPCYNEEEVLPETSKRLTAKLGAMIEMGLISEDSKIVFVNDGSKTILGSLSGSIMRKIR